MSAQPLKSHTTTSPHPGLSLTSHKSRAPPTAPVTRNSPAQDNAVTAADVHTRQWKRHTFFTMLQTHTSPGGWGGDPMGPCTMQYTCAAHTHQRRMPQRALKKTHMFQ